MQVRLLLGSAGGGKTFRCLSEARQALIASPEGLPLMLVAPKQGTYQLEQQLLADTALAGYTRLSIFSFESLARFIFKALGRPCPGVLSQEGRVMVLRALLAQNRSKLRVFRASARLTGFAQQLSQALAEVQRARLSPADLRRWAASLAESEGLALKLEDLATLLQDYLDWLESHELQDDDALLRVAADLLRQQSPSPALRVEGFWVDGLAEFTELELDLICALLPCCSHATLTFCLEGEHSQKPSWLSHWSTVSRNLQVCRKRLAAVANVEVITETMRREGGANRFSKNPVLQHLERCWASPRPYQPFRSKENSEQEAAAEPRSVPRSLEQLELGIPRSDIGDALKVIACKDREAEVTLAAREILAFVRGGGRYREVSVLLRKLDPYYQLIQRNFSRYQIPFFLDRRESVSHHPLAELTRSAVRLVTFGWRSEDWFAALKSGLVPADDEEIDLLETEALARGWDGPAWQEPIRLKDVPKNEQDQDRLRFLEQRLEDIRRRLMRPFEKFIVGLAGCLNSPTGPELASTIRELWKSLQVESQLEAFSAAEPPEALRWTGVSVHETVWRQLNAWLDNAELAFPREPMSLREWVPVLEAGLSELTVGIIPPALDQVLVGAVDRSRTPEIKFALLLGLNESVFPAIPDSRGLLTESDRFELEKQDLVLGSSARRHLGRERYLAYIACTRARQKLIVTWAAQDSSGAPLNPSPLVSHLEQLFPGMAAETGPDGDWKQIQHPTELIGRLLRMQAGLLAEHAAGGADGAALGATASRLQSVPGLGALMEGLQHLSSAKDSQLLDPEVAGRLYGPVLRTSVSRMEQFAACPFRFFVHSGLRAEERRLFELDIKEQGSFQHEALARFHQQLRTEKKRWRDITSSEARDRIGRISRGLLSSFRGGLLEATEQSRFTAAVLTDSMQDFVETLIDWMRGQYRFDPVEVELPFGEAGDSPAWNVDLEGGKRLELYGRIDRIDLYQAPGSNRALCVVVDYKSSQKQLDPLLVAHGLQLQLLSYLNVVRQWPDPGSVFGAQHLEPAGVFYVNLRGDYENERSRTDALADPDRARKLAYRHSGRFDVSALRVLDARPEAVEGDQFNYRLTSSGQINKQCREALATGELEALLRQVAGNLRTMGQQVYAGRAEVDPYRIGARTACDQCPYQSICRVDPWTHNFRVLRLPANQQPRETVAHGPS